MFRFHVSVLQLVRDFPKHPCLYPYCCYPKPAHLKGHQLLTTGHLSAVLCLRKDVPLAGTHLQIQEMKGGGGVWVHHPKVLHYLSSSPKLSLCKTSL